MHNDEAEKMQTGELTSQGGPGAQLREAREARDLTIATLAHRLHLSERYIEAIEANDWAVLPDLTFARGYVRSYARAVGLDGNALVAIFDAAQPKEKSQDDAAHGIASQPDTETPVWLANLQRLLREKPREVAIGAGILLVLMLVVFSGGENPDEQVVPSEVADIQIESAENALLHEAGVAADPTVATPVEQAEVPVTVPAAAAPAANNITAPATTATPVTAPVAAPAIPKPAAAPVMLREARLEVFFNEDCWVEIINYRGDVQVSRVGQAGEMLTVNVKTPAEFKLGNAAAAVVSFDGQHLATSGKQVAQFTLR